MKCHTAIFVIIFLLTILTIISDVNGQREHEHCRLGRRGRPGQCLRLSRCPSAMRKIRRDIEPQICDFHHWEPIVCCPDTPNRTERLTNENPRPTTVPPGTKSKQKCEEYANIGTQPKLHFVIAVVGGMRASAKEFPHMAALGFGEKNDIQWLCGGTLISDEYVLTAAHCLYSQEWGDVKFVRLGDLNLKSAEDDAQVQNFEVASAISNPDYLPPSQYNDIALIKLDHPAEFTSNVKPACLQTEFEIPQDLIPTATGWGRLGYTEDASEHLMKVDLSYFTTEKCKETYKNAPQRQLSNGIDGNTQICAGGLNKAKDTCQGDSGGPLQIEFSSKPKQFSVIGVTSFGKGCGVANTPGVYTRVSNYIEWIEETIWTNV